MGNFVKGWPEHLRFVTEAERLGYDSCALFDHPNRLMECWTLMGALAASTERIRLISMVSCIYYRSALMLARQAADVDRVSGGRLVLGVGIGDDVPEFAELGLPFERVRSGRRRWKKRCGWCRPCGAVSGSPARWLAGTLMVRGCGRGRCRSRMCRC